MKDTDAHFDNLVRKLGDVTLAESETAGEILANLATETKPEGVTPVNRELMIDVTRALNEQLESTAVEALLSTKTADKDNKPNSPKAQNTTAILNAAVPAVETPHFIPAQLDKPTKSDFQAAIHTYEFNAEEKMFKVGLYFKNLSL